MTSLAHIALVGNSLPRRCGIATFTTDLRAAIASAQPGLAADIVAINDRGQAYDYPPTVRLQIAEQEIADYERAADALNASGVEVVCLQHEFGIFGGPAGAHIIALLSRLRMPVVTTLHTVLAAPTAAQRAVMSRLIATSSKLVVMAAKGRELLRDVYMVPDEQIEVIPHGIPDAPLVGAGPAKDRLGFAGKSVILTFGLLSPNKGIEIMIDAMPDILKRSPDAVYVVLGATHPNLVREHGEAYRQSLVARVQELGIEDHVVFLDRFVDLPILLEFISMCDVYVTPYLNEAQMTSGTLAYSFGMGKPVVSTPYWHASELLAGGCGMLVPFGDTVATGTAVADLLTDDVGREAMSVRAYGASRMMTWAHVGARYLEVFDQARQARRPMTVSQPDRTVTDPLRATPPGMNLGHFLAMSDDTGLYQHAVHSVPDRSHGYCVDDNARALLLACALNAPGEQPLSDQMTSRFAAFVQHAWNPDNGHFRNFMGFSRSWLEDRGSEDSHGRTLWALGECARSDANPVRRRWASSLFARALPATEHFTSPRAWAFTLLGLDGYCATSAADATATALRGVLMERLLRCLDATATADWVWFEQGLAYDNARLSQALLVTGLATDTPAAVSAGLRTLRWLMARQTAAAGHFRPVGTAGFADRLRPPRPFDQQPLEATATIAACLAAWRCDGDPAWQAMAARAFAWFLGSNDLSTALVDLQTGSCRDGLHPDRANDNRGGESVVCYLLGLADMRQLARANARPITPPGLRAIGG